MLESLECHLENLKGDSKKRCYITYVMENRLVLLKVVMILVVVISDDKDIMVIMALVVVVCYMYVRKRKAIFQTN